MSHGYPQQPQPPATKQGRSTGKKVALGCGIPTALVLLLAGGCAAVVGKTADVVSKDIKREQKTEKAEDQRTADKDVKITTCAVQNGEYGIRELDVRLKVANNGTDRANYLIGGEVLDQDGNQITTVNSLVDDLNHGATKIENRAALATEEDLKGVTKTTCKVLNVDAPPSASRPTLAPAPADRSARAS
ncbi:hypothetical protein [Streptomyces sp. NPDC101150]|uniref:hypothetical protein n=1 Tax=Streptomyces sp. NPDC101150 TaxID=3366114 RepID=UPI003823C7BE